MREFPLSLQEAFATGLRRHHANGKNKQQLVTAYNVKIGPSGMEAYPIVSEPFTGLPSVAWPHPQLFKSSQGLYALSAENLYSIDGSTYTATSHLSGIAGGTGLWSMADFGAHILWANGSKVVQRKGDTGVYSVTNPGFTIQSICNYRQQLVVGGIGSTTQTNWVAWSPIGQVTLSDLLAMTDTYVARKNTGGFMPMPWQGTVQVVKPLGKYVVAYGTGGVSALVPANTELGPTFGRVDLHPIGIKAKGAIGGDEKGHLFIDKDNWLYSLDENLKLSRLGYQEYMSLLGSTVVVSLYDSDRDYYIADSNYGYMYSSGLSTGWCRPLSVVSWNGSRLGTLGAVGTADATVVTDAMDMGLRSIKHITGVELVTPVTGVTVAMDYLFSGSSFTRQSYKPLNKVGWARPDAAGTDFRLCIYTSNYTDFYIERADLRWSLDDKRNIRGPYATSKTAS